MDKTSGLIKIAQDIANDTPGFHIIMGPGPGDHATRDFMYTLRDTAHEIFGKDYSEKRISGKTRFAVDFWFPEEMTVVELAFTLRNAQSELSTVFLN